MMIKDQIVKALEKASGVKNPEVDFASNPDFGDYSSNVAMRMAQKGENSLTGQTGNFLKNIEWITKNIRKNNWKDKKFNLPVGRLNPEVVKSIKAKSDLVYLNGFIYSKINGWLGHREGHKEVLSILPYLPYICAYPLEIYEDNKNNKRNLFSFDLEKFGVVVIEVLEEKDKNEIVTIFFVNPRRLKSGILGKYRIPSLQAPLKAAGASFSGLQEIQSFYNKLEKKSQGVFSLNYGIKRNPREQAEGIKNKLLSNKDIKLIVEKIDIAGPGFINFWLKKDILIDNLIHISKQKYEFGKSEIGNGKTVVIDYSSPNIAKRFSIGHLRSTIIGQALYNLYKFTGWTTIGDNHLGDWGTQFGVLIYMVKREKLNPETLTVNDWEKLYVDFHKELETNKDLEGVAAEEFRKLEQNDPEAKKIWQVALNTSMTEYQRIYDMLRVKIDYAFGESFYEDKMQEAIKKAIKKGIVVESSGAKVIEFDKKYKLPSNVLVKSNGATTYLTRDLALMFFRKEKWDPDLQIFEVGAEQSLYFKQVFAMAEMLDLFKLNQLKHIAHGLIRLEEGKMSTRKGKTIKLEDVLDQAIERAKKLGNKDQKTAEQVGIGAVKYFDLSHQATTDFIFDWDKMLAMEGNSGPYLQYTFARTQSVVTKAIGNRHKAIEKLVPSALSLVPEEVAVLRKLAQFPEIIVVAAKSYSPNILCEYLYDLASKFNTFYNKFRILPEDEMYTSEVYFRLLLTKGTGQVIKNGLKLLGIEAPEKM